MGSAIQIQFCHLIGTDVKRTLRLLTLCSFETMLVIAFATRAALAQETGDIDQPHPLRNSPDHMMNDRIADCIAT